MRKGVKLFSFETHILQDIKLVGFSLLRHNFFHCECGGVNIIFIEYKYMPKPRTPKWTDSVEEWEDWIDRCLDADKDIILRIPKKYEVYQKQEIKAFGTGWNNALKWGDDKKYLQIILNNWKFMACLDIQGKKPRLKELKSYMIH